MLLTVIAWLPSRIHLQWFRPLVALAHVEHPVVGNRVLIFPGLPTVNANKPVPVVSLFVRVLGLPICL